MTTSTWGELAPKQMLTLTTSIFSDAFDVNTNGPDKPNKPMVPTAPNSPIIDPVHPLQRHIGRSLDRRTATDVA